MKFCVLGIKFNISYILVCALTLFIASDRTGLFIPLSVSVLLHEAGHIAALYLAGSKITAVKLVPGKFGIEHTEQQSKSKAIICLFAGPLCNLLAALICILAGNETLFSVNLCLALYNLLPVKGLDGGGIITTALSGTVSVRTTDKIILVLTLCVGSGAVALFLIISKLGTINYSLLLFALYLILPFLFKKN